jgi:hypothetical protein
MRFYKLVRKHLRVYDDYTSMIVRANNFLEARRVAVTFVERAQEECPENAFDCEIWEDPERTSVETFELSEEPEVISTQFRHG